jgi:flavin-dependent dehydrogenase
MREPEEVAVSGSVPMREHLVAGGGLAGAMAGLRLADAGRDVVLYEKERTAHHKVCGEFLSPEAVAYLREAGVNPVSLGAVEIGHLRVSAKRRVIETDLPFRALSLSRRVLDEALLARAAEAGCDVRHGETVQRLTQAAGEWTADLAGGGTERARTVFLATGKHDLRGWKRPEGKQGDLVGFKMHWRLSAVQTTALRGFMDLYLFDGGYGGLSLVEEDTANLCLVVRRVRLQQIGDWRGLMAAVCEENELVAERLMGAEAMWERPLAISSIPYGYLASNADGAWRVGDQAAVIPSFTGDGMAIALHSGALAAEMCLAGKTRAEYLGAVKRQLRSGMRIATLLSQVMVSRPGRKLAPAVISLLPRPIDWIAQATRIPVGALHLSSQAW